MMRSSGSLAPLYPAVVPEGVDDVIGDPLPLLLLLAPAPESQPKFCVTKKMGRCGTWKTLGLSHEGDRVSDGEKVGDLQKNVRSLSLEKGMGLVRGEGRELVGQEREVGL
jgi:hypothetical protein